MRRAAIVVVAVVVGAVLLVGASAALDAPSRSVSTTTIVQAPREDVWRILLDFDDYADWNPYLRVTGSPVLGGSVDLRFGDESGARELEATILVLKPPRKLRLQSRLLAPGIMDVEYEIIVAPVTPRVTKVIQRARDEGVVVPLTSAVPTRAGLEQMAAALARRAEENA